MGFFDDDPFEDIIKEFFGEDRIRRNHSRRFIKSESEDRVIDFVEDDDYVYLVFELPGYKDKDVSVEVRGKELEINAKKENCKDEIQDYLSDKLCKGVYIKKILPNFIIPKGFKTNFKNGILEVIFNKK